MVSRVSIGSGDALTSSDNCVLRMRLVPFRSRVATDVEAILDIPTAIAFFVIGATSGGTASSY
jgi:hypothetical protein